MRIFDDVTCFAPVDRLAARLLMKSPWWAKVPDDTKAKFLSSKEEDSILIDMSQPAPDGVTDLIGQRFGKLTVIGFADKRDRIRKRITSNPKPKWWVGDDWDSRKKAKTTIDKRLFWWAQCLCGRKQRVENKTLHDFSKRADAKGQVACFCIVVKEHELPTDMRPMVVHYKSASENWNNEQQALIQELFRKRGFNISKDHGQIDIRKMTKLE